MTAQTFFRSFLQLVQTEYQTPFGAKLAAFKIPFVILTLSFWLFVIGIAVVAIFLVRKKINRRTNNLFCKSQCSGVTILKPLKGLDNNLEQNLQSFFEIEYPKYEIICCVAEMDDPARQVAERLVAKYPHIDACVVVGNPGVCINPKINNLSKGYNMAKYDYILISDSNVLFEADTLSKMVALLEMPNVGLVHQLPTGIDCQSFGAELESAYLGTQHARMYLVANAAGVNCVVGKSMLFRKTDLDKCGGIENFGKFLAEDYFIGKAIKDLHLKHVVAPDPIHQPMGVTPFLDFARRRIRWTRLRKNIFPATAFLEPLSESLVPGLLGCYGASLLLNIPPLVFLIFHYMIWLSCDLITVYLLYNKQMYTKLHKFLLAWFIRELLFFPLYFCAIFGSTVGWRGNKFKLQKQGRIDYCPIRDSDDSLPLRCVKVDIDQQKTPLTITATSRPRDSSQGQKQIATPSP
jgi:ceramide glucosyltransferase